MSDFVLTLPDGANMSVPEGSTGLDAATRISGGLARVACAVELDGTVLDLTRPLPHGGAFKVLTFDSPAGRDVFRHSSAHLLAQAVLQLFPEARPTIGPSVDEGFYYDFDHSPFGEDDLERIEARMVELTKLEQPIERLELSKAEALELFKDNPYKVEMITELAEGTITAYRQGDFVDLCRGPHLPSTGRIKAVKVLKVAGAYWRGDAKNRQLQRVYAISFPDKKLLKAHLDMLEEAKKRDHRKIGKELELFSFQDVGPGFPFWHPNGMLLRESIIGYWRELHRKYGYQEIATPCILEESLWHRSGHWDHYRDNMYFTQIDERPFAVKPMNCPGGLLIYKSTRRSYRDLPLRMAELGLVHRHEMSGVLHGLFRVRCFTQDDAHIYCMEEQLESEVVGVIRLVKEIYGIFGFNEIKVELSTRPDKRIGSDEIWDKAENGLKEALAREQMAFELNPGDGAFYGPKIDFHIRDCMGRSWQCGTIQVDFAMPSEERFNAQYEGADGKKHHPVMIHRAVLGSLERFIGILLENTAGKLPLWLSPRQMRIIPLTENQHDFADRIAARLTEAGLRVEIDRRNETVSKKVRDAQLDRVNYQLVVGPKEEAEGLVSVRTRGNAQLGVLPLEEFITLCREEIRSRKNTGE